MIDPIQVKPLINQLSKTINLLTNKYETSAETQVKVYLDKYTEILTNLENNGYTIDIDDFSILLNNARGYLETSNMWDQDFLNEMGNTEEMIKNLKEL